MESMNHANSSELLQRPRCEVEEELAAPGDPVTICTGPVYPVSLTNEY